MHPYFLRVHQLQVDNIVRKPSEVSLVARFALETIEISITVPWYLIA